MCDSRGHLSTALAGIWGLMVLAAGGAQAGTLPPDPTNAALLYYQAFLLQPQPNEAEDELVCQGRTEKVLAYLRGDAVPFDPNIEPHLRELEGKLGPNPGLGDPMKPSEYTDHSELFFLQEEHERQEKTRGMDPKTVIRNYVKRCRRAIELAQAASEIPECDWGLWYSQGIACPLPQGHQIRLLSFVLRADAMIHVADGDFRAALDRSLMMHRFSRHIGDDTPITYSAGLAVDALALRCIQMALGSSPPDVSTLQWLKDQLSKKERSLPTVTRALKMDFQEVLQSVRNNTELLGNVREAMHLKEEIKARMMERARSLRAKNARRGAGDTDTQGYAGELTDEDLVAIAAEPYASFLHAVIETIEGDMCYGDKVSKLYKLSEGIKSEFDSGSATGSEILVHPERALTLSVVMASKTDLTGVYRISVQHRAHLNAVLAGIEIYLIKAKSGQLPECLPAGLPTDPFTGHDFIYEITEDGFTLSLPGEDTPKPNVHPYEFRVKVEK